MTTKETPLTERPRRACYELTAEEEARAIRNAAAWGIALVDTTAEYRGYLAGVVLDPRF